MKRYNENETYTLHFMFSYKFSTYQIFMDTCNQKYQKKHIKLWGDNRSHKTSYMIIYQ